MELTKNVAALFFWLAAKATSYLKIRTFVFRKNQYFHEIKRRIVLCKAIGIAIYRLTFRLDDL
ncbi:MAG: hypothetical protein ACJAT4_001300 [Granulosicoccus sp.]